MGITAELTYLRPCFVLPVTKPVRSETTHEFYHLKLNPFKQTSTKHANIHDSRLLWFYPPGYMRLCTNIAVSSPRWGHIFISCYREGVFPRCACHAEIHPDQHKTLYGNTSSLIHRIFTAWWKTCSQKLLLPRNGTTMGSSSSIIQTETLCVMYRFCINHSIDSLCTYYHSHRL